MGRSKKLVTLSKKLSFLLRHHPEKANLVLGPEGFTTIGIEELAERINVPPRRIRRVVETDPKERFTIRGGRIRANYGHSVPVGLDMWLEKEPTPASELPQVLFHGTAPRNMDSIMAEGLQSRGRQLVHLSVDVEAARRVGSRHARSPHVLHIDVEKAIEAGVKMWKAGPETVLSTDVPPSCIDPGE